MGGITHLKPTAGYQMSTSILGGMGSVNISCKIPTQSSCLPVLKWKVCFPGLLMTQVPGWNFPPQAYWKVSNINYDIGLGSINISCKITNVKVLAHLRFKWYVLHGSLTNWIGFCASSPQQRLKCQLQYYGWATLIYPVKFLTAKFLSTGFISINLFSVQGNRSGTWREFRYSRAYNG
jgi:hypothetical protein